MIKISVFFRDPGIALDFFRLPSFQKQPENQKPLYQWILTKLEFSCSVTSFYYLFK